jgi:hypothetical protein
MCWCRRLASSTVRRLASTPTWRGSLTEWPTWSSSVWTGVEESDRLRITDYLMDEESTDMVAQDWVLAAGMSALVSISDMTNADAGVFASKEN